jgi:hypothetical protein
MMITTGNPEEAENALPMILLSLKPVEKKP